MIDETDVSRALEQTIEASWYNLKERRSAWVGTIGMIAKRKQYTYKELLDILDSACIDLADSENSYMPKLGNFVAYIRDGKIAAGEKTLADAVVAWNQLSDCEWCLRGQRHGLVFSESGDEAEIYYFRCQCKRGRENPERPIYLMDHSEIEGFKKKYGERFYIDKTCLYAGTKIEMPTFKQYDSKEPDNVPF